MLMLIMIIAIIMRMMLLMMGVIIIRMMLLMMMVMIIRMMLIMMAVRAVIVAMFGMKRAMMTIATVPSMNIHIDHATDVKMHALIPMIYRIWVFKAVA